MEPTQFCEAAGRAAALTSKIVFKSSWPALLIVSLLPGSSSRGQQQVLRRVRCSYRVAILLCLIETYRYPYVVIILNPIGELVGSNDPIHLSASFECLFCAL
jgi:uncharacterized membrane protein YfhO